MEWYLWLLIGYVVLIFINTVVGYIVGIDRKNWTDILALIVVILIGLVITPFLWLIAFYYIIVRKKNISYKTFTIHELTDENKITLRELGFKEGKFCSLNNIDYEGFRYNGGEIAVQYNGRVFAKYDGRLSRKQKHLIEQIKKLPKPIDYDYEIEELQKKIKVKKEGQKNWDKWYQEDVDKLNEQIKELKLKKEENK